MEQEREEAIRDLRGEFDARIQRVEERMNMVEGQLSSTPTRETDSAVGGQVSIHELEKRVIKLEVTDKMEIEQAFPSVEVPIALLERHSPEGAPSDIPPAPTRPIRSTSTPAISSTSFPSDNPFITLATSNFSSSAPTSPSTFSSTTFPSTSPQSPTVSAPGATAMGGTGGDGRHSPDKEERDVRMTMQFRILEMRAKMKRSPSPLGEDLFKAVKKGRLRDVRRLIDSGADVNYIGKYGASPLTLAVQLFEPIPDIISLLLERGADVNDIDMVGLSPLHYASKHSGHVVDLLTAAGADVDVRYTDGSTPLHFAADNDNESAVRALLAAGARKSLRAWIGPWKNLTPFERARSVAVRGLLRP